MNLLMQGFSVMRVWFYVIMSRRYHEHGVGCFINVRGLFSLR